MNPTAPLPGALGRWLRIPRPRRDPRLRLICFSYAGGNAATYHAWSDHLPSTIEVCGVQLPGRAERFAEPPFTRMSALLAALEPLLNPWLRGRPFAFFGHSLGALLAFELTRRLRRHQGPQPLCLFASGCPAPQLRDPEPSHALSQAEFLERLRQMNGMPEEVLAHEELLEMVLPTVQADYELEETREYLDEEPLDIPITVLGGRRMTRPRRATWRPGPSTRARRSRPA